MNGEAPDPGLPGLYVASSVVAFVVMVSRALSGGPRAWHPLIGLAAFLVVWCTHRTRFTESPATSEHTA